jgi:dihydroorotase
MKTLIKNARMIDPFSGFDGPGGVLFEGETILDAGPHVREASDAEIIDADGLALMPGLIDLRVSIGEPGAEHKETLKSAGRAGAAGGVTTMVVMPTTNPIIDQPSLVEFIKRRGAERAGVRVLPAAALTQGLAGETMTEIGLLNEAGAVLFSNGDHPIVDGRVLRRALSYATAFNAVIAHRPQDPYLARHGVMHEGELSARLGLPGIPAIAERVMVERDLAIAEVSGGRLLLDQLSCAQSLAPLRRAKADGVNVCASVSAHHLLLNELEMQDYRTFAKLDPPLRSEHDRAALCEAVSEGLIDFIVSAHDPRPPEEKRLPFDEAASGASGLETLLATALTLHHRDGVPILTILRAMTLNPALLLNLPQGRLSAGAPADMILVDVGAPFRFDAAAMVSKCKNSPLDGRLMQGLVRRTIVGGKTILN